VADADRISAVGAPFDGVPELVVLASGQHEARQLKDFGGRKPFGYRHAEDSPPLD
jgi:hypothetical protein